MKISMLPMTASRQSDEFLAKSRSRLSAPCPMRTFAPEQSTRWKLTLNIGNNEPSAIGRFKTSRSIVEPNG